MSNENNSLGRIFLDLRKEVITLALERLVADSKHLVKHQNIALRLDGHREGETHLHAGRIVLELLIHKIFELGELHDVIVHGIDFRAGEAEQRAIQVHIFTAGQLRVESHAKFNERDQLALDGDGTLLRSVNLRNNLQQCGLSGSVTPNNAEKVALLHLEIDIAQHMLFGIAFDALRPIQECHLQAGRLLGG